MVALKNDGGDITAKFIASIIDDFDVCFSAGVYGDLPREAALVRAVLSSLLMPDYPYSKEVLAAILVARSQATIKRNPEVAKWLQERQDETRGLWPHVPFGAN